MEKNNWKALAKIGGGVYETTSGVLCLFGHGLAAFVCRKCHAPQAAVRYANAAVKNGVKMMEQGMNEFKW